MDTSFSEKPFLNSLPELPTPVNKKPEPKNSLFMTVASCIAVPLFAVAIGSVIAPFFSSPKQNPPQKIERRDVRFVPIKKNDKELEEIAKALEAEIVRQNVEINNLKQQLKKGD